MSKNHVLLVGESSFANLREQGAYYVDKTAFIPAILNDGNVVSLITRPRRFGKTLLQSTLQSFFEINYRDFEDREAKAALFDGLKVASDKAFCEANLGRWPVLFVSFKEANGDTFEEAVAALARIVSETAQEYAFLADSERLLAIRRQAVEQLMGLQNADFMQKQDRLANSLKMLVQALYSFCNKKVIVLIDEYDVPLHRARVGGYYEKMMLLLREMLGGALKDNKYLRKGVVTGCLRISKESVFTGLNNFGCHTISDNTMAEAIGFTSAEAARILADFGLSAEVAAVKRHYDGYRFGEKEIYCPWDLLSFCRDAQGTGEKKFKNYWIHTSSNDLIEEFLHYADESHLVLLRKLLAGQTVEAKIVEDLSFAELNASHSSQQLLSLLYCTGYLTAVESNDGGMKRLRVPNEEVRDCFERQVATYFSADGGDYRNAGRSLMQKLVDGEGILAQGVLQKFLTKCISVRDASAEGFYHGLVLGLLGVGDSAVLESNRESGDGYSDIRLVDSTGVAVILEIKRTDDVKSLPEAAARAMAQIHARRYGVHFATTGARMIRLYGVAFSGKHCLVVQESYLPQDLPGVSER